MDFTYKSSLEYKALLKIAITLWSQGDSSSMPWSQITINNLIAMRSEWKNIENKVVKNVSKLGLPHSLEEELSSLVRVVGWQRFLWEYTHRGIVGEDYARNNLDKLCWTSQGTVDKKKTAKILIKDKSLGICERYKLACIYCLDNDIYYMWKQLNDLHKVHVNNIGKCVFRLLKFWTPYLKQYQIGDNSKLHRYGEEIVVGDMSCFYVAFQQAVDSGNEEASKYFLEKLTLDQKREIVKAAIHVAERRCLFHFHSVEFPIEYYSDVFCFLLSKMDEQQQKEVFKSCPAKAFKCLLDWPWQDLFMKTVKDMMAFLSEDVCANILSDICDKFTTGYKDYDYKRLFWTFWQAMGKPSKQYIIDDCISICQQYHLLKAENKILKNAVTPQRKQILTFARKSGNRLLYSEKLNLLKFFAKETPCKDLMVKILSKDIMMFREEFNKCLENSHKEYEYVKELSCCILKQITEKERDMCSKKRNMEGNYSTEYGIETEKKSKKSFH